MSLWGGRSLNGTPKWVVSTLVLAIEKNKKLFTKQTPLNPARHWGCCRSFLGPRCTRTAVAAQVQLTPFCWW